MTNKKHPRPRGPYDRKRRLTKIGKESLTHQDRLAETNLEFIMQRFQATGQLPQGGRREPIYMDVAEAPDFDTQQTLLAEATQAWEQAPDAVRNEYRTLENYVEHLYTESQQALQEDEHDRGSDHGNDETDGTIPSMGSEGIHEGPDGTRSQRDGNRNTQSQEPGAN